LAPIIEYCAGHDVIRLIGAGYPGHDSIEHEAIGVFLCNECRSAVLPRCGQLGNSDGRESSAAGQRPK
jgi:hypothetical protein